MNIKRHLRYQRIYTTLNIKRMVKTDMFKMIMCAAPWVIGFMVWG